MTRLTAAFEVQQLSWKLLEPHLGDQGEVDAQA